MLVLTGLTTRKGAIVVASVAVISALVAGGMGACGGRSAQTDDRGQGGFVTRDGKRLYLDGRPYRFVGVNLPWANDGVAAACGPPVTNRTLDRTLDRVSLSANAVRVFFFQSYATVAGRRDWWSFDRTLRAIANHGLKVIVTLGDHHGTCGDPGGFKDSSWYRRGYADARVPGVPATYRDFVREVVTRYRDHREILAWQLTNEASAVAPDGRCSDDRAGAAVLRNWTDDMAGMIRGIDPHHLISLGTGVQGGCGYQVTGDPSHNDYAYVHSSPDIDLCEYHDYNATVEPLPEAERQEMASCAAIGKAFFVGELGIPAADPARLSLLQAKLTAQFHYGREPAQGILLWELGGPQVGVCDQYCAGLGDPALSILGGY